MKELIINVLQGLLIVWWIVMSIVTIRKLYMIVEDPHKEEEHTKIFSMEKNDYPNLFSVIIIFILSTIPFINWLLYEIWRSREK